MRVYLYILYANSSLRRASLLTIIEIVFPPFEEDYLRITVPAYQEWLQTITFMRNGLNLPNLTLRVYMADISAYDHYQGLPGFRRGITKERGITIVQMYNRTLMPLAELKGLGKFFVHLTWPFARTKDVVRRHQAELGFVNGHERG
jgi:hypothetical protein